MSNEEDDSSDKTVPSDFATKKIGNNEFHQITENAEPSNPSDVVASLDNKFQIIEDLPENGISGLRIPQLGALFAVLGHWTLDNHVPATVVMPTGTGKTETMLSLYAKQTPDRLLVLVPSDALRTQIAEKFSTWGIVKKFGLLPESAMHPVVGIVKHKFDTELLARGYAQSCNVIVTTPNALMESDEKVWKSMVSECSHLFVDEAHHTPANTWNQIVTEFVDKNVVQFTATPYRSDGSLMKGKIIYNFPLKRAQKLNYFSKINYESVFAFSDTDELIAEKAIEYLRKDIAAGHDHIMMARAKTKKKAERLLKTYSTAAPDLNPVYIHSLTKADERKKSLEALAAKSSRILICVDMFGEGFDMPSLKIAAIHEPHRSLGVTLQFIGRFARVSGENLGDATIVVNRGEPQEDIGLKRLYAEDPDWNEIISDLSEDAIGEQEEISEFENGFQLPPELTLRNIEPKMSTVVYKTNNLRWHPDKVQKLVASTLYTNPIAVNETEHVIWFVTKETNKVGWGNTKSIEDTAYNLVLCYWDDEKKLLYINGSSNSGSYKDVAEALCEDNVELVKDLVVYRSMATLKRRIPTNVGLKDTLTNMFQMNVGPSVADSLTGPGTRNKFQTNIFAHGYDENGAKVNVGASLKGRVWSNKTATNLKAWMNWCDYIGKKLTDESIQLDELLKGFIIPKPCEARPDLVPLLVEWPSDMYMNTSEYISVEIDGTTMPLIDTDMVISDFSNDGPIPFELRVGDKVAKYKIFIGNKTMNLVADGSEARIKFRNEHLPFSTWIMKDGLRIQFEKQTVLEPEMVLLAIDAEASPFDREKLDVIDWEGIDIQKEPQGPERDQTTVQARAVRYMTDMQDWDVIIDDDGSGEIADLVGFKLSGGRLQVNLVHCKASKQPSAGSRLGDVYELCGQAQKSIQRRRQPYNMVKNLIRRERNRRADGKNNIIIGSDEDLQKIAENIQRYLIDFTVTIVQPGLSKSAVADNILELIAATESYISDVGGNAPLRVVINE